MGTLPGLKVFTGRTVRAPSLSDLKHIPGPMRTRRPVGVIEGRLSRTREEPVIEHGAEQLQQRPETAAVGAAVGIGGEGMQTVQENLQKV